MAEKIVRDDGTEVEVYTAEEVQAKTAEAVKAKESEFGKTRAQIESERDEARAALGERAGEFKQFRELHKDVVAKLGVAERTIYENQLAQKKAEDDRIARENASIEGLRDAAIKSKAGSDEKLATKMKEMWSIIGIDARTPEEIENKSKMVLGAIGFSQPDLVASVQGFNGSYQPPAAKGAEEKSFADSERGKAGAADLGLTMEPPKK